MDLVAYYQSLEDEPIFPKKEIRDKIKEATGKADATIYRYLNGKIIPDKPTKEAIAKALNMDVNILWPEHTEESEQLAEKEG